MIPECVCIVWGIRDNCWSIRVFARVLIEFWWNFPLMKFIDLYADGYSIIEWTFSLLLIFLILIRIHLFVWPLMNSPLISLIHLCTNWFHPKKNKAPLHYCQGAYQFISSDLIILEAFYLPYRQQKHFHRLSIFQESL